MNPHNHPQSKQVINRLSRAIGHLEDHINHCVVEAAKVDDQQVINDLISAINMLALT